MKITLNFQDGILIPDNNRNILILIKKTNSISNGYYDKITKKYYLWDFAEDISASAIMWAEQPKKQNDNISFSSGDYSASKLFKNKK